MRSFLKFLRWQFYGRFQPIPIPCVKCKVVRDYYPGIDPYCGKCRDERDLQWEQIRNPNYKAPYIGDM